MVARLQASCAPRPFLFWHAGTFPRDGFHGVSRSIKLVSCLEHVSSVSAARERGASPPSMAAWMEDACSRAGAVDGGNDTIDSPFVCAGSAALGGNGMRGPGEHQKQVLHGFFSFVDPASVGPSMGGHR